jgi:hypothetical protein
MGDDGAYTKSPVAGSNDMGGTAKNLNQGGTADTKGTGGKVKGELKPKGSQVNMVKGGAKGSQLSKVSGGAAKKGDGAKSMFS